MPDTLSPAERAAIAAFPVSRVQRIAQGVSGEAALTFGGWRTDGRSAAPGAVAQRRAVAAVKRKQARALIAEGVRDAAVVAATGLPAATVRILRRDLAAEGAR